MTTLQQNSWKTEFLRLFGSRTVNLPNLELAMQLKDQNLPKKLFKFRGINKFSLENLRTDTVWLCSANRYNDPYDSASTWSGDIVFREIAKQRFGEVLDSIDAHSLLQPAEIEAVKNSSDPSLELNRILLAKITDQNSEESTRLLKELTEIRRGVIESKLITQLSDKVQSSIKVCSFSEAVDSILMWGHYASSHTGFALGYDIGALQTDDLRRRLLHPVIYSKHLFDATEFISTSANGGKFNNLFGVLAAMHKGMDWSYEREWRLIFPSGPEEPDRNIGMPRPSAIYLGSKIRPEHEVGLLKMASERRMQVYKMKLSATEFSLVAEPI